MKKIDEEMAELNHHTRWAETLRKRTGKFAEDSNWWPFMQNIEDVLDRLKHMTMRFDAIENEIKGVDGKIKNLRKILIKLEVIDDRFIF
tara:strand:+ start:1830 stop:2096 length:267 start_codon:yes stop_codon:yes gene_type:complete